MIMKKNVKTLCIFASLLTIGFAATSCDAPSKDESITEVLDVVAYADYPYSGEGYYVKQNGKDVFQTLVPNTKSPFVLYVKPFTEEGVKTLKLMKNFTNPYVTDINEIGDGGYFVTTTKYFESPQELGLFYVSNGYQASESADPKNNPIYILPQIVVKMKEGKDISTIIENYKSYVTLSGDKSSLGSYVLDCKLDNAFDVLKLAGIIYYHGDVEWAEPNKFGGSSTH
jgi:hypothetical protein